MNTLRPMQPPELQPIGFWTARAGDAIRNRIRAALAEVGVSQPEWWLLHQISLYPTGADRAETVEKIGHNDTPEAIVEAIESARAKGLVVESNSRVTFTPKGEAQFRRAADVQQMLQDERMQGIGQDEYVTTIRVLQRTIQNVGGDAWHW
ncbi:MarR family winged helix-turn-helix transcriptional regulator [Rhodococcus sp. IEGM 1401]|uniref:MarR family winged helix-turn-helix transcriptional regulator n=1 Tax=unclassified Rhodococcus (in: high G+C Gram-positive bacteria) TaxID=192944 RepID=UPI0022B58C3F|nr:MULTISPECIES: MarR family winged helix-turn-helix transcriptional regulator [unclassified Rhodococcus (in: high G+C Gram-positive bacteria)]MCZ4562714.1 MarR family winged helix-turn-helix transcriptional regulator [Rhodococcus sp. IEGM 1401]MDI9922773.1 MarR family winged helix-turn-helix transcriptional regulator [Rhodococcus sp. IEGM 1372]MDV8035321.1 MarR family winged helix-turn-helix transcriptional regulator [Rhodococcus sp. IEGM 1414]